MLPDGARGIPVLRISSLDSTWLCPLPQKRQDNIHRLTSAVTPPESCLMQYRQNIPMPSWQYKTIIIITSHITNNTQYNYISIYKAQNRLKMGTSHTKNN